MNIEDIKEKKQDQKISIAIMSSFAILAIQYLILYYFNLTGSTLGSKVQMFSKALVGFFFLLGLPIVLRRNWRFFIGTYMISISVFLYNHLIFNYKIEFLKGIIIPFFLISLPCFLYSYTIRDRKVFKDIMERVASIVLIVGLIISTLTITNRITLGIYSMSLSYYMLLPTIVNLNKLFQVKSLKSLILSTASLMIIISLGSRGPIMCIGTFIVLYILNNRAKLTYSLIVLYSSLLTLFIFIIFNLNKILLSLYNFLESFGIRSRTLLLFMRPNIHLSGRENLYKEIIYQIKENPILGIGIVGDRFYIGGYVHNIFLEVLSGFGVIVGTILIALLILICYKSIKSKGKDDSNLSIMWISIGLIPLLVSGSYLTDFHFWIFLGLILNIIFNNEYITEENINDT